MRVTRKGKEEMRGRPDTYVAVLTVESGRQ